MSYSETVTKEDLKNILNEVLPQSKYIQSWEYVGNYGSNVFNNSWTATDDGVAIVRAGWSTGGAFAYWYVKDQTDGRQVVNLGGTANGTTLSTMIPIIKGHTYQTPTASAVTNADFYFYKFTLKETTPESAADYIVDQGTSGDWTYRKWNSGFAECWWQKGISVSGGSVDTSNYIDFPFTFIVPPIVTTGLRGGGIDAYRFHTETTTTTQVRLILINTYSGTVTITPQMYVVGTWK